VDSFDRLRHEPIEFTDVGGDRVLIEFIQRSWSTGSDVPVELRTWSLATVRDGNLVRSQLFQSRRDAHEAAGLPDSSNRSISSTKGSSFEDWRGRGP